MKTQTNMTQKSLTLARLAAALLVATLPAMAERETAMRVVPPGAKFHGKTYGEWAAAFWQWAFALPCDGHPFKDHHPVYDLGANQMGRVWYWSAPDEFSAPGGVAGTDFDKLERWSTIPTGTALFLTMLDVECSSLEIGAFHGDTPEEQRALSKAYADLIAVDSLFCEVDGAAVHNLHAYRFSTPQFAFTAPTPWVFGGESGGDCSDPTNIGGTGTAVGEGYFLMVPPMSEGTHTIHYGGRFRFTATEWPFWGDFDIAKDVTIHLTVK